MPARQRLKHGSQSSWQFPVTYSVSKLVDDDYELDDKGYKKT